jgi:hypothetical protein
MTQQQETIPAQSLKDFINEYSQGYYSVFNREEINMSIYKPENLRVQFEEYKKHPKFVNTDYVPVLYLSGMKVLENVPEQETMMEQLTLKSPSI